MPEIQLHNREGKVTGKVELPVVLEGSPNKDLLWQAVRMYLANQRQGTVETKTRGEVRGGGRKPWKQKHTGRARAGSIRSPIWRKGGIVFGPHQRDYRYELPKKIRRRALLESLKAKLEAEELLAVESLDGLPSKTKAFAQLLKALKRSQGALVVVGRPDPALARLARNIPRAGVKAVSALNCYDVLVTPSLVLTREGLEELKKVLS